MGLYVVGGEDGRMLGDKVGDSDVGCLDGEDGMTVGRTVGVEVVAKDGLFEGKMVGERLGLDGRVDCELEGILDCIVDD